MSKLLIAINQETAWAKDYQTDELISFEDYLHYKSSPGERIRLINLCGDYSYLKEGYYCSLLSEARGHHVIPTSRVLNDVSNPLLYQLSFRELEKALVKIKLDPGEMDNSEPPQFTFKSYFGRVQNVNLKPLARLLFEYFPCPILEIVLSHPDRWDVYDLRIMQYAELSEEDEKEFAQALFEFSRNVWKKQRETKAARYDMAILVNPEEAMPPSDEVALRRFVRAGKDLDIDVELISPADYMRVPEFDALFIRETTAIDHHTYRFAKKAESEGVVVMDDPNSILRCTNKIYLADLFNAKNIPAPRTLIIHRNHAEQLEQAAQTLGLPLVIKIPDGSFSRGMVKVSTLEELEQKAMPLFEESSLLLAQEFLYTDFDWRIGVINNKPLYACRYYMVKNHWQIYRHSSGRRVISGRFDTLPIDQVPKPVLQAALKATKAIGDGFYGVDVKESSGRGFVIEVNDNPSIDSGVEDRYLGKLLYQQIMEEFIRRIDARRSGLVSPPRNVQVSPENPA